MTSTNRACCLLPSCARSKISQSGAKEFIRNPATTKALKQFGTFLQKRRWTIEAAQRSTIQSVPDPHSYFAAQN
jgi:hypothetical protein